MGSSVRVSVLLRALLLAAVWTVLTGAEAKGIAVGVAAVPAATWASLRLMPAGRPPSLWRLLAHIPGFVAGSVRGGVDVARRAVSPDMRLRPGWTAIRLAPGGVRVAAGAELSLMPGTLAAGSDGDWLRLHLIDTRGGFERSVTDTAAEIVAIAGDPPGGARRRA